MTLRAPEFAYVTGGSSSVVHRQAIARGGFGEVHELYDVPTQQIFARKLLDVRGLRREVIRTEEEAIKKVCGKGGHRNVITVLWLGDISGTEFYGIDMELCGLNLELFIHRKTYPTPSESVPFYIKDGQPPLREQQVWNVMKQLADGVKYIHSLKVVHRDLKPANSKFRLGLATDETVLYSRKDSCWKLADFGFASEGNSSTLRRSNDVRGTTGYRAPELLANGNATFNNKADIWSLGCILFELSVGRRPFFHDYATAAYGTANDDMIVELDDSFSCECKRTLASTIISMLKSCPKSRPSAIQLLKDFNRYIKDTKNAQKQSPAIDNVERTGPMRLNSSLQAREMSTEMRDLVTENNASVPEITAQNSAYYQSGYRAVSHAVQEPLNYWLWHDMCRILCEKNNAMTAIAECISGCQKSLNNPSPLMALSNLYAVCQNYTSAVVTGMNAFNIQPSWHRLALLDPKAQLLMTTSYDEMKQSLKRQVSLERNMLINRIRRLVDLNVCALKIWLSANCPIVHNTDGQLKMHFAAWTGNLKALESLVLEERDITQPDNEGWTTLHLATWNMHHDVVTFLLDVGSHAWVSAQTTTGLSALHLAAWNNDIRMIKILLDKGADFQAQDEAGRTPMIVAAEEGRISAVKALKEVDRYGVVPVGNRVLYGPLHVAARYGYAKAIDVLLKIARFGATLQIAPDGVTPLHLAAEYGHLEAMKTLMANGAYPWDHKKYTVKGENPMHRAASNGQIEALELLLKHDASFRSAVDANRKTPLHYAAFGGHINAIVLLQKYGAKGGPGKDGKRPSQIAEGQGHLEAARLLQAEESIY